MGPRSLCVKQAIELFWELQSDSAESLIALRSDTIKTKLHSHTAAATFRCCYVGISSRDIARRSFAMPLPNNA
jgi:hypothetical protein